jgi:hypothetical protein
MNNGRGTRLAVVLPHTAEMDDALMVRRVGELIIAGERGEASELLASIPEVDRVAPPARQAVTQETVLRERDRRNLSAAQKFAVHERYGWRCQYCGRRVVIAGVIELVGRLCREVRWWPNDNMAKALTHPAAARLYPNVDHIKARAVGGHATAGDNLICSCTTCNERKGTRDGWQPIVTSEPWNGCVPLFAPLYDLARAERATLTKAIVGWLDAADPPRNLSRTAPSARAGMAGPRLEVKEATRPRRHRIPALATVSAESFDAERSREDTPVASGGAHKSGPRDSA